MKTFYFSFFFFFLEGKEKCFQKRLPELPFCHSPGRVGGFQATHWQRQGDEAIFDNVLKKIRCYSMYKWPTFEYKTKGNTLNSQGFPP